MTTETATVAAEPKTTEELLAIAEARVAKLKQKLLTEQLLNNVEKGDEITIKFGRGDKVRHITGSVAATNLPNLVVIGSDLDSYKVHVRDIIENKTAAARSIPADPATSGSLPVDPETGTHAGEAGASADPLENA